MKRLEKANFGDVVLACLLGELEYGKPRPEFTGRTLGEILSMAVAERQRFLIGEHENAARDVIGSNVEWWKAEIAVEELEGFHYQRIEPWVSFTGGSCLVSDSAATYGGLDDLARSRVESTIAAIERGADIQPLVAVTEPGERQCVVIRGCARVVAYVRHCKPERSVAALLGEAEGLSELAWWPPARS